MYGDRIIFAKNFLFFEKKNFMIHAHIKALSKDRITSYTKATLGNNKLAIDLYEKNIQLSKYEFEYIGRFELILRNKINTLLTSRINNNWYRDHWDK